MVSPEVVRKRLRLLEGHLKKLRRIRETTDLKKFLSDGDLQDIVDRNLQLAIESVLEIGQHIIASSGWEPVDEYADIFIILAKHGVLSEKLVDRVRRMTGFRNILVHEYADIDHSEVFDVLQDGGRFRGTRARVSTACGCPKVKSKVLLCTCRRGTGAARHVPVLGSHVALPETNHGTRYL